MMHDPLHLTPAKREAIRTETLAKLRRLNLRLKESRMAGDMSDAIYFGVEIDKRHRLLAEIEAANVADGTLRPIMPTVNGED